TQRLVTREESRDDPERLGSDSCTRARICPARQPRSLFDELRVTALFPERRVWLVARLGRSPFDELRVTLPSSSVDRGSGDARKSGRVFAGSVLAEGDVEAGCGDARIARDAVLPVELRVAGHDDEVAVRHIDGDRVV